MKTTPARQTVKLEEPRIERRGPMLLVGLRNHYDEATVATIPELWTRFSPHIGEIPRLAGPSAYGVCFPASAAGGFDYMAAVEIAGAPELPEGFGRVSVPARRYAIFAHRLHVSQLRQTAHAIHENWLPASGFEPAAEQEDLPMLIECYGPGFEPATGLGDTEVWLPLKD